MCVCISVSVQVGLREESLVAYVRCALFDQSCTDLRVGHCEHIAINGSRGLEQMFGPYPRLLMPNGKVCEGHCRNGEAN